LFKRYKNAKKIEYESLEKLTLYNQQYNVNFKLIEETIQKQNFPKYGNFFRTIIIEIYFFINILNYLLYFLLVFKQDLHGEYAYFELLMELKNIRFV